MNFKIILCTILIISAVVGLWYWYESRWDRQLFKAKSGRLCVNVHPHEAQAFLDAHPDTQVLDVRSDAEFSSGALPGAIQISIGDADFEQKLGKLDKSRPVLVYCAGGYRSRKAAGPMKAQGFINIQHLHRGYHSWQFAGLPVVLTVRR